MHSELWHILLGKNCCKLTRTVVTEVEEDDSVAFLDSCKRLVIIICNHDRLDELIGHAFVVRSLDGVSC